GRGERCGQRRRAVTGRVPRRGLVGQDHAADRTGHRRDGQHAGPGRPAQAGPPDADRDTFLGHGTPPRRVAAFGEQLPQLVFTHGHRAYLFLSAGVGRSVSSTRSRASARLAWLFTVPAEQPRMFATWASVMSW